MQKYSPLKKDQWKKEAPKNKQSPLEKGRAHDKSPFGKGGFRGIFKSPPAPLFKRGEL
jgi:hypothetical protein